MPARAAYIGAVSPQVTVVMGAYNVELYVAAALASIRDQTFTDFTVLVVDAGSTDATAEVVSQCAADDARIRLISSPHRLTIPEARNAALAEVATELVATLDADDLMLPGRLAAQLRALRAHAATVAIGGHLRRIDSDGLPLPGIDPPRPATPAAIEYALPFFCPFLASAGMYRMDALRAIGGFDESSPFADDYPTIWALSQLGEVRQLPTNVGEYRRHSQSTSSRRRHSQQLEVTLLRRRIAAAIMSRPPSLASVRAWTTRVGDTHLVDLATARAELVEFHESFMASRTVPSEDEEWIGPFYERHLARLTSG